MDLEREGINIIIIIIITATNIIRITIRVTKVIYLERKVVAGRSTASTILADLLF